MDKLGIILPENAESILVAVSGGADSVALLSLLREAAQGKPVRLTAAHFEHGIRGEASLQDAAFVRSLCAEWDIPLLEGGADVPAMAREKSIGLEEAARTARYAFLREAQKQVKADFIALAHHRDDQAETVLMHLLRGSGLRGAAGMRETENGLYRPLLKFSKETLVAYLREKGIAWREDATNQVSDNPRNGLRLQVVPAAEQYYPGARQALARFAGIVSAEDEFVSQQTDRFLEKNSAQLPNGWLISLKENPHEAILRRAVHAICRADYDSVLRIMTLKEQLRGALEVPGGWRAERGREGIYLLHGQWSGLSEHKLAGPGTIALGVIGEVHVSGGSGLAVRDNLFCQELDGEALDGAVIRTRRPGDVIRPLGAGGGQKLSDYLINKRIDRPLRDLIPLVVRGNRVLWVMGVGISEEAKLREGSNAVRLELTGWPLQKFGGRYDA